MKIVPLGVICLMLLPGTALQVNAQETLVKTADRNDPQTVLAYQGEAILTQAMIDGAFSRVPEAQRLVFIRDGAKVDQLVRALLQSELVALDAEAAGFTENPIVQQRMLLAARKELSEAWLQEIIERAPAADYAALAHEDYLVNPQAYTSEPMVDVTHILIGTEERTLEEAQTIAVDLRSQLAHNADLFDDMVSEFSEDPSSASNNGHFHRVKHGKMVKPFEDAAFALQSAGDMTEPVETQYGYHLIRLDRKHEPELQAFEKIQEQAMERAKLKHLGAYRLRYLQKLLNYPIEFPPGSVEVMARRHFGEDFEDAPKFNEDGVQ